MSMMVSVENVRREVDQALDGLPSEVDDELVVAEVTRAVARAREREIAEAYRRGYAEHPQELWVGEAGLRAGAQLLKNETSA
jgi:hypothetical protein